MKNDLSPATSPQHSATVSASAGTGKTWLLVTRLIRLLLDGARPDGILAVTFTRKAAAEMQTRLAARLLELARSDDEVLQQLLEQIHAPTDAATLARARQLYEELLRSPYPIKATTFHAFCQDILRRFPLEAGVAPGFELLESGVELQEAAWDALVAEAGNAPNDELAQSLETLIELDGGLSGVRGGLNAFLAHRSDWWAYTEGQTEPLVFATNTLAGQLQVDPEENPAQNFFSAVRIQELREFAALLGKHAIDTNQRALDELCTALDGGLEPENRFDRVANVFLTQQGTPRARKESGVQKKKMGEDGEARFLDLHSRLCAAILAVRDIQKAQHTLLRTTAWYRAGQRLLEHYQRLKAEQRLLDFADLEWKAYQLLNHADNAHWIQYKLDQRIDHLLIDEFQDTNPTQWRLVLPLLEELAAGANERQRSVFLVGDGKQSIYRFRRADPELFDTAQSWLQQQLDAVTQPLNVSWRSAPAVMEFVNRLFGAGPLNARLTHFTPHSTHHQDLWGWVEVLPLVEPAPAVERESRGTLRNPLAEPRVVTPDQRHLHEGRLIASRIRALMTEGVAIGHADAARALQYNDIMILLRQRSHAPEMEQALREAGIPYASASRGTLLESLEAQDMLALLEWLVAPFDNLALARVLRSPLFGCDHDDLIALAREERGDWRDRLAVVGPRQPENSALRRAHASLESWREGVGQRPVHDLLDRIYCDGDVLRRYEAAYPAHLRHRAAANLNRFLELALEIDNGRYPSIGHFVARLRSLRQQEQEAPDEGTPTQAEARVRIMTIHASKGLEAPVVFLADTANAHGVAKPNQALLDWPASEARPTCFLLTGKKDDQDPFTRRLLEHQTTAEAREDANLLYVAITRARQMLFISGCRPNRGHDLGWYGLITESCTESCATSPSTPVIIESGRCPIAGATATPEQKMPSIDPRLSLPLTRQPRGEIAITPSGAVNAHAVENDEGEEGRTRGIAIHRLLQLLCENAHNVTRRVGSELGLGEEAAELDAWLNEARRVFTHSAFSHLFEPSRYSAAYNEVPIQYDLDGHTVHGIIDRLVVSGDTVWLLDYKTHAVTDKAALVPLIEHYRPQMRYYAQGVQRIWPQKQVRCGLLFTAVSEWVEC